MRGISGITGDTATFTGSATATVSLNGVSPSLSALNFNTTSAGQYTVAVGSSGALTVNNGASAGTIAATGGTHVISAPITLSSNLNVTTGAGDSVERQQRDFGRAFSLTAGGSGLLVLSGANTYGGTTTITGGTVSVAGGTTGTTGAAFFVGNAGTGVLNVAGGYVAMSSGTVGSGSGIGTITQSSGTLYGVINGADYVFGLSGGTGSYTLSGGSANINALQVGWSGTGTYTQTGGTMTIPNYLGAGRLAGGPGLIDIQGGLLQMTTDGARYLDLNYGGGGNGTFRMSGGTVTMLNTDGIAFGRSNVNGGSSTMTINGGSLNIGSYGITKGSGNDTYSVTLNGGTLGNTATFNSSVNMTVGTSASNLFTFDTLSGTSITLGGILSGSGQLTKMSAGTLILGGVNTFSGNTRIAAGTLTLSGGSALQNSTLDMNSGDGGGLSFGALTAARIGGLMGSRNLAMTNASSAAVALTVGSNGASTSYSGILSGGSLIKVGGAP